MARQPSTEPLQKIAKGFRDRTLVSAKLATKLGTSYLKRALVGSGETSPQANDDGLTAARELVREIGALKGLVMKFGQIASYMPGALSPQAQRVLTELQSQTTAMAYERVVEVVEEELGGPVEEMFDHFEPEPFAAASIGQVHRATLEGRPVAVKIQYPGIEDALRSDLRKARVMSAMASLGTAFDGRALADELSARVLEECDYGQEARNQTGFRELFAPFDGARVPEAIAERTSRRVLTSDFVDGREFYAFADTADDDARGRAGATIFRTCFQSIFGHYIYNADPHPGNYLFSDDGGVTFLDFGCVRRFDPLMIEEWKTTALAILDGDRRRYEEGFINMGLVPKPDKFDWDHQWKVMQYIYRPYMSKEPFCFTPQYVQQSYDLLIFKNPNRNRSGMPPSWLFLNRLQWGLNAVLGHLRATADWRTIWREALESPGDPAGF